MKEQLYTIPVNDAFDADTECPVCAMHDKLQADAVDFVMGPSYMEDDVRMETNAIGFCSRHLPLLYKNQNRLGLGLMMLTYMDRQIKEIETLSKKKRGGGSLFSRAKEGDALAEYLAGQQNSCYVCKRMAKSYERYLVMKNKGKFQVFAMVPAMITESEYRKLRSSKAGIRVSIEPVPMGTYKSFAYEIFKRRPSTLIAYEGNIAGANMIQEAKNSKYPCRIYVNSRCKPLRVKAESLEGYVTLF